MLVCKYNNVFLPIMFNIMFRLNQYVHSYNTRNLHKTFIHGSLRNKTAFYKNYRCYNLELFQPKT